MFNTEEPEGDEQKYQDIGGFKVRVPGGQQDPAQGQPPAQQAPAAPQQQPQAQPEQQPRPTFGQRISSSGDEAPPLTVPGGQDTKPLDQVAAGITNQYPPPPPSPQQTYGQLLQKRAGLGTPTDRAALDPVTGKPKYRMGMGERVLGTVGNFLSGFGGSHRDPTYVGPGATNHQYDVAESTRQANLENVDTQIKQQKDLGEENRKLFESANKQAYDQRIGEARGETAAAQQEAASARTMYATEKARHDQADEERKKNEDTNTPAPNARPSLQKNPATGKVELMVKTKGGQMVPYTPKTAEEGALLGDTNARNMFNYMHRKSGGKDEDNPELNGLSAAEQRDFKNRTKLNDKKIDSLMGARRDAVLFKQDTKDIDKQLADAQGERDQVRDDILSHRKGGKLQNEATQRQQSNPQTGRKVGDVVTVKGQKIKITKMLPGGKYEGVPAP